ncbi:MAG: 30S ribosomal protein S19 [Candidatus Parcubacteria bacterium]|nr:30S ribosomal protein S19 [Candidatus Parcubacteria bacterium]
MARSLKKGPYTSGRLLSKIAKLQPSDKTIIKTWSRACTITPEMVGFTFGVHNGKDFVPVRVEESMVGHRLGEFSSTTKFGRHGGRMQKDLESSEAVKESVKTAAAAPAAKK